MKAAVVDTSRSDRLRAALKAPRTPPVVLDCPDQLQLYLNRLTALVPTAPKHRPLSKLEVIQCVIDYICDLEDTLLERQLPARGREGSAAAESRPAAPADRHGAVRDEKVRWVTGCGRQCSLLCISIAERCYSSLLFSAR